MMVAVAGVCWGTLGCSGPCEELQPICDHCLDPNHKYSCERSVDRGAEDVCQQDIPNYCDVCGRRGSSVVEDCK